MGDFKVKENASLMDAAANRESRGNNKKNTVSNLTGKKEKKDKGFSAKVYPETWAKFTQINRARGMSNNSVINMLMTEYVLKNEDILNQC